MTDTALGAPEHTDGQPEELMICGQRVIAYAELIAWIARERPARSVTEIEAIALREAEAFLGGRHVVLPADLRDAVLEVLDEAPASY